MHLADSRLNLQNLKSGRLVGSALQVSMDRETGRIVKLLTVRSYHQPHRVPMGFQVLRFWRLSYLESRSRLRRTNKSSPVAPKFKVQC